MPVTCVVAEFCDPTLEDITGADDTDALDETAEGDRVLDNMVGDVGDEEEGEDAGEVEEEGVAGEEVEEGEDAGEEEEGVAGEEGEEGEDAGAEEEEEEGDPVIEDKGADVDAVTGVLGILIVGNLVLYDIGLYVVIDDTGEDGEDGVDALGVEAEGDLLLNSAGVIEGAAVTVELGVPLPLE